MKKIGRYIICGLLGRGGMSKVYRVSLPVVRDTAALKLLDPHPSLNALLGAEKIRDLFITEARTMAGLRHPNIVSIRDFDETGGKLFYVMEYFSNNLGDLIGETYRTEAPSRVLSVDRAIHYTRQTLQGLARLHHDRIIHRDIKPFNLIITEHDTVKICDFGLSKLRGENIDNPSNLKVGSPFYAAPEQEKTPDQVGLESDIFSVGVVLYRLLTGKLPYENPGDTPKRLSRLNTDLDSHWDDFIFEALATNPRERTPDARIMLQRLETLAEDWEKKKERICRLSAQTQPPHTGSPGEASRVRRHPIKISSGAAPATFKMDVLGRPVAYKQNRFQQLTPALVADHATGLVWQQSGTRYPLTWQNAHAYVDQLNHDPFEGLAHWRLPTMAELMTILMPPAQGDAICVAPIFDTDQKWLWSSDRCTYTCAWYVNLALGFAGKNDFSALYYAKAVCDSPDKVS